MELDFNYKSLTFICNGAERKEGIKSESSGDFRGGEHELGGTSLSKEWTDLKVSQCMKERTRCPEKVEKYHQWPQNAEKVAEL